VRARHDGGLGSTQAERINFVDSLLARINSLFSKIGFPVLVELIPCSAAQGILLAQPRKRLI
jgi:hypothetical protein